jgi:hypothetical protein
MAIEKDLHANRLPHIREAKKKILTEMQFFPRVSKIISSASAKEKENISKK